MKTWALCGIIALTAGNALGWKFTDATSWNNEIGLSEKTLVAFVDPTLSSSQALEPHWKRVRKYQQQRKQKSVDSNYATNVIAIDCSVSRALCHGQKVNSYPAIRLYQRSGRFDRYRGPRTAKEINAFPTRMSRPQISVVDASNISSILSADGLVMVAYISSSDAAEADMASSSSTGDIGSTGLVERFASFARNHRDQLTFAWTRLADEGSSASGGDGKVAGKGDSVVSCFNNADGGQHAMRGRKHLDAPTALESLLRVCSRPLVPTLTRRNELEYLNGGKSLVYYFVEGVDEEEEDEDDKDDEDDEDDEEDEEEEKEKKTGSTTGGDGAKEAERYRAEVRPLARKYGEYLDFVVVDAREYGDMLPVLGLPRGKTPALALQNPSMGLVFPYYGSGVVDGKVVDQFVLDIVEGRMKPWNKRTLADDTAKAVRRDEAAAEPVGTEPATVEDPEKRGQNDVKQNNDHDEL